MAALRPLGISFMICSAVGFTSPKCFGSGTKVYFRAIMSCPIKSQLKMPLGNGLNSLWDPFGPHYGQFAELEAEQKPGKDRENKIRF